MEDLKLMLDEQGEEALLLHLRTWSVSDLLDAAHACAQDLLRMLDKQGKWLEANVRRA